MVCEKRFKRKSKVVVESLISNVQIVSAFFSAKKVLEINELRSHWGYTILNMKKNK